MGAFSMFDILILGMGVYVIIAAIRGKGKLFVYQNVKEGMEEKFVSTLRLIYGILGAAMVINGMFSIFTNSILYSVNAETGEYAARFDLGAWSFLTPRLGNLITILFMLIAGVCLIALFIVTKKMTDKNAAKQAGAQSGEGSQRPSQQAYRMPSSAFEFDESEKSGKKKK